MRIIPRTPGLIIILITQDPASNQGNTARFLLGSYAGCILTSPSTDQATNCSGVGVHSCGGVAVSRMLELLMERPIEHPEDLKIKKSTK